MERVYKEKFPYLMKGPAMKLKGGDKGQETMDHIEKYGICYQKM